LSSTKNATVSTAEVDVILRP